MAAYGGHNDAVGLQIFVTVRRGAEWPPRTCDVRVRYDQTLGELRAAAARALGLEVEELALWRHGAELLPEVADGRSLLELDMHTGFGLSGWDLRVAPVYWPPVVRGEGGGLVLSGSSS